MTLPKADVVVLGVGARTATGLSALAVAMTARAGKSQPRESHFVDRAGAPICLCTLASLGADVHGQDRLVALAAPALFEATQSFILSQRARVQAAPKIPLIVALPEALPTRYSQAFLADLAERAGIEIDVARSSIIAQGRAGGVVAIEAAALRISRGEDLAIAVGGVDSYFDADRLEALDRDFRLHGPLAENGFIPGEGAGFVLLTHRKKTSARIFGQILGVAAENEPRAFGSPEPSHALGLTAAMKRAFLPLGSHRVTWALTDVVSERHRVDEWLYATGRLHEQLDALAHDQPLMRTGDLGAATATTLLVIACVGFETGFAKGPCALVSANSDGPPRGAIVIAEESR